MMNKLLILLFLFGINIKLVNAAEAVPGEEEILTCQDQADVFGNGKSDDIISKFCLELFIKQSPPSARVEFPSGKIKFYGYRNMIIIEKESNNRRVKEIIAGNSTELKSIQALAFDENNKEIVALDESGEVLSFTTTITGNIAPYRILRNKEIEGASELVIDYTRDQIIVNNKKTKKILFFSRLANINGRKGKQRLMVLKTINTLGNELTNLSIDQVKSELNAVDSSNRKILIAPLE